MKPHLQRRIQDSGEFLWLIALSDLMILLFLLFVVLFSFAAKKMKQADMQNIVEALRNQKKAVSAVATVPVVAPVNPMEELKKKLDDWAKTQNVAQQVEVKKSDQSVTLEIKDKVFFASGQYVLHANGYRIVKLLAKALEKIPTDYQIGIEGHTDDVPIYSEAVQDNWELSSKRALAVLSAMGLPPEVLKRTSAIARGEMVPLVPNRDATGKAIPENQNKNRRVTIRVFLDS